MGNYISSLLVNSTHRPSWFGLLHSLLGCIGSRVEMEIEVDYYHLKGTKLVVLALNRNNTSRPRCASFFSSLSDFQEWSNFYCS